MLAPAAMADGNCARAVVFLHGTENTSVISASTAQHHWPCSLSVFIRSSGLAAASVPQYTGQEEEEEEIRTTFSLI